ncbi:MAG: hypothetical protein ACI9VX_001526 [Dinoroseobacter sp.]|jgi:hypothetical protein
MFEAQGPVARDRTLHSKHKPAERGLDNEQYKRKPASPIWDWLKIFISLLFDYVGAYKWLKGGRYVVRRAT